MLYKIILSTIFFSKKISIIQLFLLSVFLYVGLYSNAQDIHFSDFYASPLNTNPALTGVFPGNTRIMGILRDQYRSVTTPYQTVSIGFDRKKDKIFNTANALGYGILINSDVAGDSKMGTYQIAIPLAFHQYTYGGKINITYGVSLGYTANTIDYSNLRFPEEYEGDRRTDGSYIDESTNNTLNSYFSLGAGFNVRYNFNDITGISTGFAIFNLNNPNPSMQGNDDVEIFRRYMLHGLFRRKIAESIEVLPSCKFQFQGPLQEIQFGGQIAKYFDNLTVQRIHIGSWFRAKHSDAVILNLGFEVGSLQIGASYDINISKLQEASNNQGGLEISFIYIYNKKKSTKKKSVKCPTYF